MGRVTYLVIFAGCLILFLGCGQKKDSDVNNLDSLKKIAMAYWNDRLIERNYEDAYAREMESGRPDFKEYKRLVSRNESFRFSGLKIIEEKVDKDSVCLTVAIKAGGNGLPVAIDRQFKDFWRYDSGKWKHRYKKRQL